jgi:hypothetical protein
MRLVISIQSPGFIFDAHKASLCRRQEAFTGAAPREKQSLKKRASSTRSAFSIILAEVGPVEVVEIRRAGLLRWVNELEMEPRRESFRPRRV